MGFSGNIKILEAVFQKAPSANIDPWYVPDGFLRSKKEEQQQEILAEQFENNVKDKE